MSKAYKLAKKYYPGLWNLAKLRELVEADLLTVEEFEEITGREWSED